MGGLIKKKPETELVWDKKRILIGVLFLAFIIGSAYFAKIYVLDRKLSKGEIAGTSIKEEKPTPLLQKEDFGKNIETIKRNISELEPEDIIKQEPVKKIIQDLDNLKTSTQEQVVGGAKNAVCEQAKKVFCSQ